PFPDLALGSLSLSQSARAGNRLMDVLTSQTEFNPPSAFVPISIRALEPPPLVSFVNCHSAVLPSGKGIPAVKVGSILNPEGFGVTLLVTRSACASYAP